MKLCSEAYWWHRLIPDLRAKSPLMGPNRCGNGYSPEKTTLFAQENHLLRLRSRDSREWKCSSAQTLHPNCPPHPLFATMKLWLWIRHWNRAPGHCHHDSWAFKNGAWHASAEWEGEGRWTQREGWRKLGASAKNVAPWLPRWGRS